MARAKKEEAKKAEYSFDFMNEAAGRGVIKRVLVSTDKVNKYSVDVPQTTEKGKTAHSYLTLTEFTSDDALEEGTAIEYHGRVATSKYNDKYTTEIVADAIEEI